MKDRRIEIRIEDSDMTVGDVVGVMLIIGKMNPDREVFLDGDEYAIVSQVRE